MALYLGFDSSTQGLTAVVIDSRARSVVFRESFQFDEAFPEFGTIHGVLPSEDRSVVHAPPRMWADALARMLQRVASQIDRTRLRAISGAAQQHGSVYCGATPEILARTTAPVWMDSSTTRECLEIERALGGPAAVAQLTGSRTFPRFTGPQIRKFAREDPTGYERTARIHLVSSYLASLLTGEHAPIDHADGSGMNLMDLRTRAWSPAALEATAPDLQKKLPQLVASSSVVGTLSDRWRSAFDLPAVRIVAWSGDNPCSLVGTGLLREGQLAISLGTSDTVFGPMSEPRVSADGTGHVFASPTGAYMGITVFRNGSLARERVRDQFALDWDSFSEALRATEPGNGGAMMLPWFEPEITPFVPRPSVRTAGLEDASSARHVRALVEGQILAMARHSAWMGVTAREIFATGGATASPEIVQTMADVFDATVCRFDSTNSAALGAALRAYHADSADISWDKVLTGFVGPVPAAAICPVRLHSALYRRQRAAYGEFERFFLSRRP